MDMPTFRWWISRARGLEEERDEWRAVARRLADPYHDDNCQYGVKCSYCTALEKASKR